MSCSQTSLVRARSDSTIGRAATRSAVSRPMVRRNDSRPSITFIAGAFFCVSVLRLSQAAAHELRGVLLRCIQFGGNLRNAVALEVSKAHSDLTHRLDTGERLPRPEPIGAEVAAIPRIGLLPKFARRSHQPG